MLTASYGRRALAFVPWQSSPVVPPLAQRDLHAKILWAPGRPWQANYGRLGAHGARSYEAAGAIEAPPLCRGVRVDEETQQASMAQARVEGEAFDFDA